jgi:hypothetical protein
MRQEKNVSPSVKTHHVCAGNIRYNKVRLVSQKNNVRNILNVFIPASSFHTQID